ncbi:MAG: hypothetical protein M3Y72_09865 [Acidobacteriota bacterium]|nr:hypothetical protein [Acidobacteriota bacterium]
MDDWPLWRKLRLEALEEAPYAFSSTLVDWQGEGDTEARWRARLSTVPLNVVADLNGTVAGMVSATAPSQDETIRAHLHVGGARLLGVAGSVTR